MGGDPLHKALFLWPFMCYIEFPGRGLGLALQPRPKGSPGPTQFLNVGTTQLAASLAHKLQKEKGSWKWLWVPTQEGASSRQHGFVLARICLLTRQREIMSCEGIRRPCEDDRTIPALSNKLETFKGRRLLTQNTTLRKVLPSLLQDNQNFSQTPNTRVSLPW